MKFIFHLLFLGFLTTSVAYATSSDEVKNKTKEAAHSAVQYTKEQKDAIEKEMEESVASMKAKVSELRAQSEKKVGSAKNAAKLEIADLERRQHDLSARLKVFKKSSGKAWENMKTGFNDAFKKLSEAYDKAKQNYK